MKIRRKLFFGFLSIPIMFGAVAVFLIVANRQVQRDSRALATIHTKLGMGAAKLSAALITGQKAAEELMAEKYRMIEEPSEKAEAERGAAQAVEAIRNSKAESEQVLGSLVSITQQRLDEAGKLGKTSEVAEGAAGLRDLALIRTEARDYNHRMEKFLTAINVELREADEILNDEVEQEYEYRLLPLVQNYAAAREEEVLREATEIERSVGRVSWLVGSSAIVAVLLAIMIAVFLSRSFSQPLTRLAEAAQQIGQGYLASHIRIKSQDEIGLLARAFNQMADDLGRTTVSKGYVDEIIKSMNDSLVVASSDGFIVTANLATSEMLGYTEAEMIGQPFQMLFGANDSSNSSGEFDQEGIVTNCESVYFAKGGRAIPVALSRTALHLGPGERPAVVCVAKDITELKRATDKTLKEMSERTQVAEELRLQKVQSEAQIEASLDGVLAAPGAGIAKEINTSTRHVADNLRFLHDAHLGQFEVLRKSDELLEAAQMEPVSAEKLEAVRAVINQAGLDSVAPQVSRAFQQSLEGLERIAKIVESVKEFASPGAAGKKAIDLNRAIDSTINEARDEWKYVAEMETDFDLNLPAVPCLPGELNQMTLNMIINASHAIADKLKQEGEGKGLIRISTRREGEWAVMRISDTGAGISKVNQDRVFEPLTTGDVGRATGPGLAISQKLVEKHGGTITFETQEGQGTTFTIRLPLYELAATPGGLKEAA